MRSSLLAGGVCLLAVSASLLVLTHTPRIAHASQSAPVYAANGDMLPITNYREWVYLTTGSINTRGHFQGEGIMGFEVHVKDEARFPGKWAFFDFDSPTKNGQLIPEKAPCYSCHAQHGAVDTTFVQFYPTLLPVAREKQTLSAEFVKEEGGGK